MRDTCGRTINYLRLSITDRCNIRCCYCMPAGGVPLCERTEILRYEDLLTIAEAAVELGIEKIRITGGEPLVRRGVVGFLDRLGQISGLSERTLTTNGLLLEHMADDLKAAGVERLNVSLDSLNSDLYRQVTRGGDLFQVMAGLEAAEKAGLHIKLNMVVMRGINDHEVEEFAALSLHRPWSVRFIEYMPTIREKAWQNKILPGREILDRLQSRFELTAIPTSRLCGPAKPYRIVGAVGSVGIITPMSDHFCSNCNRIRVNAQGVAKSCLLSNRDLDLKPAVRQGRDALRASLLEIVNGKVAQHHYSEEHASILMSGIGG